MVLNFLSNKKTRTNGVGQGREGQDWPGQGHRCAKAGTGMGGPTQRKGRALGRGLLTRAREDVVRVAVHGELGRGRDGAARGRRAARWFRRSTSRRLRAVQGLRLAVGGVDQAGCRSWRRAGGARVRGVLGLE